MKLMVLMAAAGVVVASGVLAQEAAEDPCRHRRNAARSDAADGHRSGCKVGAMAKEEVPYDAAVAGKAVANIAAIASVLSMDQFPAGSEYQKAADSFALPGDLGEARRFPAEDRRSEHGSGIPDSGGRSRRAGSRAWPPSAGLAGPATRPIASPRNRLLQNK